MNEHIKYWVDLSDYDLETAAAMLDSRRFLYVGFMCHQSIEKILKAYYRSKTTDNPPFSHSLSYLAKLSELYNEFSDEQKDFIDQIEPLNIETRYPSHKEQLFNSLNETKCTEILNLTKQLQEWIKAKL